MLTVFSFDNDSNLNTDQDKEELRKVGLKDELDVGRWIAEKLQDDDQNDVSQNVIKFIEGKEESTLNSNKEIMVYVYVLCNTITEKIPIKPSSSLLIRIDFAEKFYNAPAYNFVPISFHKQYKNNTKFRC